MFDPPTVTNVTDVVHSTLLPLTHLPQLMFSAPCGYADDQGGEVHELIDYSLCKGQAVPFLLRGKQLWTFHDLRKNDNPFRPVVGDSKIEVFKATELWADPEGKRRYVSMLNRGFLKYAYRLNLSYDHFHRRFYFPILEQGKERVVNYRPLNANRSSRKVVWQPIRKSTGEGKNFWWHLAVNVRFSQMDELQWCLSVRPERHLTRDGQVPLTSEQIGKRVTRLKARMYNDIYLKEVNFWRDFLSGGATPNNS